MIKHRSTEFSWKNRVGSAEASDLGWQGFPAVMQVRSQKTSRVLTFKRIASRRDAEQEIVAYRYWNAEMSVGVEVWND